MRDRLIELLGEEIRETKNLTRKVVQDTEELRKANEIAQRTAEAAERKADAAWELVVITREDMKRPIWKKWMGK